MELYTIVLLAIGGGLVWYLKHDAKEAVIKEGHREASHIKTLEAVDYEIAQLQDELKQFGVLSRKEQAFMDALYARRLDLKKRPSR